MTIGILKKSLESVMGSIEKERNELKELERSMEIKKKSIATQVETANNISEDIKILEKAHASKSKKTK